MTRQHSGAPEDVAIRRRAKSPLKRFWMRVRGPLARSAVSKRLIAEALYFGLRFVRATNRVVPGSVDPEVEKQRHMPAIVALWHGQHILAPFMLPKGIDAVAMVSRSADAELNAMVLKRLGISVARGSGGRRRELSTEKGGGTALLALKKALDEGRNAFMIADIPHGVPRRSGLGVIKLAQHSGRPILPVAVATSRRKILEKSWDKTTLNLPFGRVAVSIGEPLHVASDLDEEALELARARLDDALNNATARAYDLVDRKS